MKFKNKKIMAYIALPLFFLTIGYLILGLIAMPYIRPLSSLYSMISQDQTPDFSETARNLYNDDTQLPTSGTINASSLKKLEITDQYGNIEIASVHIKVPLLYGATNSCLHKGAGTRIQSHIPGYEKPVMIGAHTIPYFKSLIHINKGDIVKINTYYGIFEYKITGTKIANASDTSAYDLRQNKEQLILFTCYPVEGIGEKADRFFAYADKVKGPKVVGDVNE